MGATESFGNLCLKSIFLAFDGDHLTRYDTRSWARDLLLLLLLKKKRSLILELYENCATVVYLDIGSVVAGMYRRKLSMLRGTNPRSVAVDDRRAGMICHSLALFVTSHEYD
jgi:hypothetical protein